MPEIILPLIALALVDSTSIGTLLIPLWLLSRPQIRPAAIATYIAVIGLFYFVLGSFLVFGVDLIKGFSEDASIRQVIDWLQLLLGIGLIIAGFKPAKKGQNAEQSRMTRLRDKLATPDASLKLTIILAVTAGVLEAAMMMPYLMAVGLITNAQLPPLASQGLLLSYCIVMILPALVLFGVRVGMAAKIQPKLVRLEQWAKRYLKGNTSVILGILGILVVRDALWRLGFFELFVN